MRAGRVLPLLAFACAALAGRPTARAGDGVAVHPSAQAPAGPAVRVEGRHFVDPAGRVLILRGVNLAGDSKVPPFLPRVTGRDVDRLAELGVNVLRLVFTWEAFEPEPGRYDLAYLDGLCRVAALAWSRGVVTVVDFHQDGFSRFASRGSGDGFPAWAVPAWSRRRTPDNGPASRNWPLLMATDPTTHRAFDAFFRDEAGVRTRYLAMLGRAASAFAANPGVVGYDLMNEPWGDERTELAPLYRDATAVVRSAHPGAAVFLEGHVTTNAGLRTRLPRPEPGTPVAYAPHYYLPTAVVFKAWHGGRLAMGRGFRVMSGQADAWDAPLFLGEFGLDANARRGGDYVAAVYDRLDERLASGAQWNYTPGWTPERKDGWNGEDFNVLAPDGRPRPNFRPRPYPRATAGVPLRFVYRTGRGTSVGPVATLDWDHRPDRGVTEVFLPRGVFPAEASTVAGSPGLEWRWDEGRQVLSVRSPVAGPLSLRVEGPARRE